MIELLLKLQKNSRLISKNDQPIFQRLFVKYERTQKLLEKEIIELKRIEKLVDKQLLGKNNYEEKYKEFNEKQIELVEHNNVFTIQENTSSKSLMIKKGEEFDGVACKWNEHPTMLIGYVYNEKNEQMLIFRSFTTTFNNFDILCKGVKIGDPIPQENISKYKKETGEEINDDIFKIKIDDDIYKRPVSTALFGKHGDKPLTLVGHIFDKEVNIIKEQYAWSTYYVLPISKLYDKHRSSLKEYPPENIKNFAAAELYLDSKENIEVYYSKTIRYFLINKKDIYFFNPRERTAFESSEYIADVSKKLLVIENNPENYKPKSINFSDPNKLENVLSIDYKPTSTE